jgi:hypothetical protein
MKKPFLLFTAIVLLYASCKDGVSGSGGGAYPPIVYTNDSSRWDITFKNAANEKLTLSRGESITRTSDVRGRADIIEIDPAYVTWKQKGDMYHIEFVDRDRFILEIENYAVTPIGLAESNGYMEPSTIEIKGAANERTPESEIIAPENTSIAYIYTDKPVFRLTTNPSFYSIRYKIIHDDDDDTDDKLLVAINPPAEWK